MAKGKADPQRTPARNGRESALRVDQLVVHARMAVVERLLRLMQSIEPESYATVQARRKELRGVARKKELVGAARDADPRHSFAEHLRARRRQATEVRAAIQSDRRILDALEDAFLPERGVVGRIAKAVTDRHWDFGPEPLQAHLHRKRTIPTWRDTVFGCAGRCRVAGAECIEPAILASVRILAELRELAPESLPTTIDTSKVFDRRRNLRAPARLMLEKLAERARTLDELAKRMQRDEVYVRKFSKALQDLGLVRLNPDGSWTRTDEAVELLRR